MKIIVTGAHGMLGSALVKYLAQKGEAEIYAFHRDDQPLLTDCRSVSIDLRETERLRRWFSKISPDVVIHCAGLVNVDICEKDRHVAYEQNVIVTRDLAQMCDEKTQFIFISSDQVYGNTYPKNENQKLLIPVNVYGETKLAGEKEVLSNCALATVVRTNVVGVKQKRNQTSFAEWVLEALQRGKSIPLFFDYLFSPIYTRFLSEIIFELTRRNFPGVINVGAANSCSKLDFAKALAIAGSFDEGLLVGTSIKAHKLFAVRPQDLSLDVSKLTALGIHPPIHQESAKALVQEFLSGTRATT